jgi:hypothetical protein
MACDSLCIEHYVLSKGVINITSLQDVGKRTEQELSELSSFYVLYGD